MSTKRKLSSTPQPAKKERKAIHLATKMQVIKQYEGGKKVNAIARDFKLSHSTVSTILKDKERIREAVKGSASMRSTIITTQRTGPIHEMEKLQIFNQCMFLQILNQLYCSSAVFDLNKENVNKI